MREDAGHAESVAMLAARRQQCGRPRQLTERGLDWDAPPLPPGPVNADALIVRIEVVYAQNN
jgi:hypothetical protein